MPLAEISSVCAFGSKPSRGEAGFCSLSTEVASAIMLIESRLRPMSRGGRYIDEKLSKADKSVFLKLSATYRYRKMEVLKLSKNYRYRKMHQILVDK